MPAIVVVGAQWGDEGKGKTTDILGTSVDYVVKPNGGNNAGHTVVVGGEKYELKLLPAGILSPNVTPVIGNGVVVNLEALFEEIDALESRGADTSKLRISANAHLVAPYHQTLDKVTERFLGKRAIGTTGRGIGPAYMDKIGRLGIRVQDVFDESILRQKIEGSLRQKNELLVKVYNRRAVSVEEIVEYFEPFIERLRPYVAETELMLNEALDRGEVVVMEGGQATMLDVDHGTYPFVTSSNPTAGGSCVGTGIGPTRINRVVGIVKAYTTRVGAGPFPTELFDEMGEYLQKAGGEFGVNTGRPRRCGWYDAVIARYASRVNGFTDYVLTKLDVLTGIERIPVCVAYEVDGKRQDEMPVSQTEFHHAKPIFEYFDGWSEDITKARTFEDLADQRAEVRGSHSRSSPAAGCRSSASALIANSRSCATTCWTEKHCPGEKTGQEPLSTGGTDRLSAPPFADDPKSGKNRYCSQGACLNLAGFIEG
jgi:adenylosuccinate synthase